MFSLGDKQSFQHIESWNELIKKEVAAAGRSCHKSILVGGKSDLPRQVSRREALEMAQKIGSNYLECSSVTGDGVANLFLAIASLIDQEVSEAPGQPRLPKTSPSIQQSWFGKIADAITGVLKS